MTPDDLDRIANWDLETPKAYKQFMTYIRGLWSGQWLLEMGCNGDEVYTYYEIYAAEEDEALIEAMKDNETFWTTCWESSNRHGKHVFKTP